MTRRTFLRGATSSAWALPNWTSCQPLRMLPSGHLQYDQVFFDARRPQALDFAAAARRLGARTRAIYGDASDARFQDVCARWHTTRRTPVAGITDFRSMFLLQSMAADAGLRTVLRIHHHTRGEASVHESFGVHHYRNLCDMRLTACGDYWAPATARLVLRLPALDACATDTCATTHAGNLGEANMRTLGSRSLVTWVMA